jgi:maleylpyruvate isomerase
MSDPQSGRGGSEQADRDALIKRQGSGARYDAANAPANDLLRARRGAAYFARKLNELSDDDLRRPSAIPGWSRAFLIADISYQARVLATSLEHLRQGIIQKDADPTPDLTLAATLPARAIRSLYIHSDVHLNVEFRDLRDADWEMVLPVGLHAGTKVRDLPALRAKTIWLGAVNLQPNGPLRDVPAEIVHDNPVGTYSGSFKPTRKRAN